MSIFDALVASFTAFARRERSRTDKSSSASPVMCGISTRVVSEVISWIIIRPCRSSALPNSRPNASATLRMSRCCFASSAKPLV
ncbi:hypothetical protein WR25_22955 [Diploscapter pachys]|uniref:Uncharacterized protein n=1 Tax=Diploscapter pachys TaxID=2018661 RepID=A0A2A2K428_9BILA|nr:hypothetical protein WR25_22955 [Diploscapter pachys]